MKSLIDSLFTAFSLYSAIPMPKTDWSKQGMQYALCFFPLVGVVIGVLLLAWYRLSAQVRFAPALFAAVATLVPLGVSGGIHIDGFIDTADALSSRATMEKKLEILKDPHVGAFGVLFCGCVLLLQFGLWQQVFATPRLVVLPALGAVLSRCFNGLSIALFPPSRQSGLVHLFHESAEKTVVITVCALAALGMAMLCAITSPLWGGGMVVLAVGYFFLHRRFCLRQFGGNTGDLAGFLLQNLELLFLVIAAIGGAVG